MARRAHASKRTARWSTRRRRGSKAAHGSARDRRRPAAATRVGEDLRRRRVGVVAHGEREAERRGGRRRPSGAALRRTAARVWRATARFTCSAAPWAPRRGAARGARPTTTCSSSAAGQIETSRSSLARRIRARSARRRYSRRRTRARGGGRRCGARRWSPGSRAPWNSPHGPHVRIAARVLPRRADRRPIGHPKSKLTRASTSPRGETRAGSDPAASGDLSTGQAGVPRPVRGGSGPACDTGGGRPTLLAGLLRDRHELRARPGFRTPGRARRERGRDRRGPRRATSPSNVRIPDRRSRGAARIELRGRTT